MSDQPDRKEMTAKALPPRCPVCGQFMFKDGDGYRCWEIVNAKPAP